MRRKAPNRKIFDKSSLTNQLVSITIALSEGDVDQIDPLRALVRSQILCDCAYYKPSEHSKDALLCHSGEQTGGIMLVPNGCDWCIVGQFSATGKFLGELSELTSSEESTIF